MTLLVPGLRKRFGITEQIDGPGSAVRDGHRALPPIPYLLSAICYLRFAISFEPKARMIAFAATDPTLVALRLA